MAVRVRVDGTIHCAAMHPEQLGDTYLDDGLHYKLSVELDVLVTEPMESDAGRGGHRRHGEWWWRHEVPDDVVLEDRGANFGAIAPPRAGAREGAHDPAVELPIGKQRNSPSNPPHSASHARAREGGPEATAAQANDAPTEVWSHYVEVMKPRRRSLDAGERRVIRDALKVATVAECKRAIDGCAASPFHMGQNDRHRKYNKLTQILKGRRGMETTRERIDFFLDIADKSGVESGFTSADPHRVAAAKRDVLDAHEFPGDEHVVRQGEMSAEWLAQHGWRVQRQGDGRPEFLRVES